MAKLNLYVPDDLKNRMDEVGNKVNWSEVARPALVAALTHYEHRKGGGEMDTAIERLRASKHAYAESEEAEGKEWGVAAARDDLDYQDIVAISRLESEATLNNLKLVLHPDPSDWPTAYWENYFGDNPDRSDEWVQGYVKGVREFYAEVKDKI